MKNFKYTVIGIIFLLAGYFVIDTIFENIGGKSKAQEVKTVEVGDSKDFITFGRNGHASGIFCTTTNIKRDSKIFEGRIDMLKAAKDKYFFNCWTNIADKQSGQDSSSTSENSKSTDICFGIYTCSIDGRDIKCLSEDYIMLDRPAVSPSGDKIIFTGIRSINGTAEKAIDFGMYSIALISQEAAIQKPCKLKINCEGSEDIKDISFIGNDEILYSKYAFKSGEYSTQLYRYNLVTEKEEQLSKGRNNFLNPSVSPDGKKLAYLFFSQSNGIYGINIVAINDISNVIYSDADNPVIGGSAEWSPDSSKILYAVLSGTLLDGRNININKIKVSDINKKTSEFIDEGYVGTFSPDSSTIAYANYKLEKIDTGNTEEFQYKCTEIIYKRKIGGDSRIVLQFDEECLFSKSINTISWSK